MFTCHDFHAQRNGLGYQLHVSDQEWGQAGQGLTERWLQVSGITLCPESLLFVPSSSFSLFFYTSNFSDI